MYNIRIYIYMCIYNLSVHVIHIWNWNFTNFTQGWQSEFVPNWRLGIQSSKTSQLKWKACFRVGRLDLLDIDRNNERGGNFMNSSSRFEKQTPFQIAILEAGSAIYGNWQLEGVLWDTVPWPQTSVFPMCCGNCKLNHANVLLKWSTIQSMQTTLGG